MGLTKLFENKIGNKIKNRIEEMKIKNQEKKRLNLILKQTHDQAVFEGKLKAAKAEGFRKGLAAGGKKRTGSITGARTNIGKQALDSGLFGGLIEETPNSTKIKDNFSNMFDYPGAEFFSTPVIKKGKKHPFEI